MLKINSKTMSSICSCYLALLPILQPYAFVGSLQLSLIIGLLLTGMSFATTGRFHFNKSLFGLLAVDLACGILCMIFFNNPNSLLILKSFIVIALYIVIISTMLHMATWNSFIKSANVICIISCLIIFLQYIMMLMNVNPFDGRINFLQLLDEKMWSPVNIHNIYRRRLHSIFSESSYFAMYCAPLCYYNLKNQHFLVSACIIIGVIISTSSLGIALCLVGVGLYILSILHGKNISFGRRVAIIVILTILAAAVFATFSKSEVFTYSAEKIDSIFAGESSSIRIRGNIDIVKDFNLFNWCFGIGINQIEILYPQLYNYSNAFVLTIIYYGITGSIAFLLFLFYLFMSTNKEGKKYATIMILALMFDALLYTMNFYYLLAFVYLNMKRECSFIEEPSTKEDTMVLE